MKKPRVRPDPKSRFYEPLTIDDLRELQATYDGNQDVMILLWEIARLRQTVLDADHVARSLDRPSYDLHAMIWDKMVKSLAKEPCVQEAKKWRDELVAPLKAEKAYDKRKKSY